MAESALMRAQYGALKWAMFVGTKCKEHTTICGTCNHVSRLFTDLGENPQRVSEARN